METIFLNQETLHDWQKNPLQKVMALGYFDGLHAGHCRVIEAAKLEAMRQNKRLAVMSFTPHPKFVLSDGKQQVPHLMTLQCKAKQARTAKCRDSLYGGFYKGVCITIPTTIRA